MSEFLPTPILSPVNHVGSILCMRLAMHNLTSKRGADLNFILLASGYTQALELEVNKVDLAKYTEHKNEV